MKKFIKIIILLIILIIPVGTNLSKNLLHDKSYVIKKQENWTQITTWSQTNINCNYNCVDIYSAVYKSSILDEYGRYKFCYVYQSNSKWQNGKLANTGVLDLEIYVNNQIKKRVPYLIIGTGSDMSPQALIYFNIHPKELENCNNINFYWIAKNTYLN